MKANINTVLNKLIAYAEDNLMLDSLDSVYCLNKLAALAGVKPTAEDADYGDKTYAELLDELAAAVAGIDKAAVTDTLLPLPHTINYYFNDQFGRNPKKAFEFIFDLFAQVGSASDSVGGACDGYTHYETGAGSRYVMLSVGGEHLKYSPISAHACVGALECKDFMSEDIASRMAAFAEEYGMVIAKRIGDGDYYACSGATALSEAKVKAQLGDGAVKVALLDYAVPALSVTGPKNSTVREAARLVKAASDKGVGCVLACEVGQWTKFYIVFANSTETTEVLTAATPLSACGVFGTVKLDALLSVLEKGTALPSDLFPFKSIYSSIGGVKHGAKAGAVLAAELAKTYKNILSATASCDESAAKALAEEKTDA